MIPDITPILMSLVAINANLGNDDDKTIEKEDTPSEEDNGGEVVFIFKFIVKSFRLLIVVSALVLACVMLSRFLL